MYKIRKKKQFLLFIIRIFNYFKANYNIYIYINIKYLNKKVWKYIFLTLYFFFFR